MDLAPYPLAQRAIHELVARDALEASEGGGDHAGAVMGVVVGVHLDAGARQGRADQFRNLFWIHRARSYDNPAMSPTERPAAPDAALLDSARRTLDVERRALERLHARLDARFAAACRLLLSCQGRVVVTGMGKSGHVARKIAATLASTGTPAFFMHPGEAGHGDLGMITRGDVLLALSNSGETVEILTLLPQVRRLAVPVVALTGRAASALGREADVVVDVAVEQEACPHNLAPTASTTAALAMGDALAVALLEARGFSAEDFARAHPGGNLGRRLLLHVEDLMRRGEDLPRVRPDAPLAAGLLEMSRKGLGLTAVVDADNRVLGVFTDGDLRRALDRQPDVHATSMRSVMTPGGRCVGPTELAAAAASLMEQHRVTALLVVDAQRHLVGALNVHDLMRAGVV
jgi:arabinose-5-phosphate isomerase